MAGAAIRALATGLGLLTLCGTAALASPLPGDSHLGSPYLGQPKPVSDEQKSPYPMNYADEAAQTLGVRDGHMDLFSTQPSRNNPFIPTVSGGLGGDGAMLRLQWHPGE